MASPDPFETDIGLYILDHYMDRDMPEEAINTLDMFEEVIENAIDGNLTDSDRVKLYRLGLTAAANEFYRIEDEGSGSVNPAVLTLLQQIALICDGEPTLDSVPDQT